MFLRLILSVFLFIGGVSNSHEQDNLQNDLAMKKYLHLLFVLLFLVSVMAFPEPASACSCAMPGTPQQEFVRADAVFTGRVVGSGTNLFRTVQNFLAQYIPFIPYHFRGSRTFTFHVTQSWKGISQSTVTISTGFGDADCGYSFSTGTDYVIYAYHTGSEYSANICSRTAPTSQAPQDIAYLNTLPFLPLKISYLPYLPPVFCGGVLTGLILVLFLYFRHRKKKHAEAE